MLLLGSSTTTNSRWAIPATYKYAHFATMGAICFYWAMASNTAVLPNNWNTGRYGPTGSC